MELRLKKLLEFPKRRTLQIIILLAFIGFIVLTLAMQPIETELKNNTGYGVLDFEFAWTGDIIRRIFNAWGETGIKNEAFATFLDFFYIPSYALFMTGCILIITRKLEGKFQSVGLYVSIFPFIAGIFDIIENINLLLMIYQPQFIDLGSPLVASICATIKFIFLILSIIFFIMESIIFLINSLKKRK